MRRLNRVEIGHTFLIIVAWQIVTLFLAATMISSNQLAESNANLPTLQSFPAYLFLSLIFFPFYFWRFRCAKPLAPNWKYPLVVFLDVQGNFCIILAFRYTALTSVSLLNCSTAVFVAFLSWRLLGTKYKILHLVFVVLTIAGLVLLVLTDIFFSEGSFTEGKPWYKILLGDALVILGCFFYSLENVTQEKTMKSGVTAVEYLSFFGLCGSVVSFCQGMVFDYENFLEIFKEKQPAKVWWMFVLFTAALWGVYSSIPALMRRSNALMMNLSFLVVDFWALLAEHLLFKHNFHWLRYVAFSITLFGVVGFNVTTTLNESNENNK